MFHDLESFVVFRDSCFQVWFCILKRLGCTVSSECLLAEFSCECVYVWIYPFSQMTNSRSWRGNMAFNQRTGECKEAHSKIVSQETKRDVLKLQRNRFLQRSWKQRYCRCLKPELSRKGEGHFILGSEMSMMMNRRGAALTTAKIILL